MEDKENICVEPIENPADGRYDEEIFTYITDENYVEIISAFRKSLSEYNASVKDAEEGEEGDVNENDLADLENILLLLPRPFTIVQEMYYIDRSFRDSYYKYFSNQHFDVKRYSRRLSFFVGKLGVEELFSKEDSVRRNVASRFMGACVINPLVTGAIGKTLIDPRYLTANRGKNIYVRLSLYELHIYGNKVYTRAFPYRMQDGETMRCAEVTLLNLIEYYSNSYRDYRNVLPSEILESEQRHNHERVLPSRGTSYTILTKVLSDFGFAPRLYNLSAIETFSLSKGTKEEELKRLLHYYIESGIPVALNLLPVGNRGTGHSIICIGHGEAKEEMKKIATKNKWISWENRESCHPIINSADFFDSYVVIDDNQPVYQVREFHQMSLYPDMRVENIAVPLYKRMFLDATDAAAMIRSILHHEKLGVGEWDNGFLKPKEDIVIRLFMASSKSLKEFRSRSLIDLYAREAYVVVPMPRFVWSCELYRVEDYEKLQAFGEIVIDATSVPAGGQNSKSLILVHYPHVLGYRYPDQTGVDFEEMIDLDNDGLFPGFNRNLEKI